MTLRILGGTAVLALLTALCGVLSLFKFCELLEEAMVTLDDE